MAEPSASIRVDKWLWYARFFKTRSLATKIVTSGSVRVDGQHIKKASAMVSVGDTLTFVQETDVRVVRIEALGERRGPATEAQALYEDLAPVVKSRAEKPPKHPDSTRAGRPTKKLRRDMDAAKRSTS